MAKSSSFAGSDRVLSLGDSDPTAATGSGKRLSSGWSVAPVGLLAHGQHTPHPID